MGWTKFIAKYNRPGASERSNAQPYTVELLQLLDVPTPDPAGAATAGNDYVFERVVKPCGGGHHRRIDLYKRGCVLMEHKQSRWPEHSTSSSFGDVAADPDDAISGWDVMMRNARRQAMGYVADLPFDHAPPVFVIVCDVGRMFEVWADFSGTGRGYAPFPDRKAFRFRHVDLADENIQLRLRAMFMDPWSLDPTRRAEEITREIVDELSCISQRLETEKIDAGEAAHFLMRCIFTLFAADVGLLPKAKLIALLEEGIVSPDSFPPMMSELWSRLNEAKYEKRFYCGFGEYVPYINGGLFQDQTAYKLAPTEIQSLVNAARHCWKSVEPAIFGSLLEHALAPAERRKLGAHYTPRAHVVRIVELTIMEPLRNAWNEAQTAIEQARDEHDTRGAVRLARAFHARLCSTRVLDPACGTGNFLYVALELMKVLEGEVLETLVDLGQTDQLGLSTVGPAQFFGLEINPRAAQIANLVLWIGFLQQHYRSHTGRPSEPIIKSTGAIVKRDALIDWDGAPNVRTAALKGGADVHWPNARPTQWPEAEFIVGNPPFVGGKDLRSRLDPGYAETLWRVYPEVNESADLCMYWWERAARLLTKPGSPLERFGLVTTNSITQVFQRRTIQRWLDAPEPLSLIYAVPDHPWQPATSDAAAVRIAMTVAEAGVHQGVRMSVQPDVGTASDLKPPELVECVGRINADLSVGTDVTAARPLKANAGVCSPGVKLHGAGFIVAANAAGALGLGRRPGLEAHLRPYRNGRDLTARCRDAWVLDFHGQSAEAVRDRFPEAYQHLVEAVKEARNADGVLIGRDANRRSAYRDSWWMFGEPRAHFRPALAGLDRYIATVETAKHRVFQFLDAEIVPDNMLVCVADDDAATLAVLSSRHHLAWCAASGGSLEDRPRYTKSRCFDPFPFPRFTDTLRLELRQAGEALHRHRRDVLRDHDGLTLTDLYNVLERVRSDMPLSAQEETIKRQGMVIVLRDLHRDIDRLTALAFGWPEITSDAEIVARLTDLNRQRASDEANGDVLWLRPGYQQARQAEFRAVSQWLPLGVAPPPRPEKPRDFPADRYRHPAAVRAALKEIAAPMRSSDLAGRFRGAQNRQSRINRVLATLHRYGHVDRLEDGRWMAR